MLGSSISFIRCFHHVRHYLSPPIIWSIPRSENFGQDLVHIIAIIMEKRIWHCRYCAAARILHEDAGEAAEACLKLPDPIGLHHSLGCLHGLQTAA